MRTIHLLGMVTLLLCSHPGIAVEPKDEKRTEILRMMELTGTAKLMNQVMDNMMVQMQQSQQSLPPSFFDRFREKAKASPLVDLIIPIYEKYYSLEDLKAINAFYSTPVGKRLIAVLPQLMQETMAVGQAWGEKLGREAGEEAAAAMKQPPAKI